MEKSAKVWLVLAIISTVYLVYCVGLAELEMENHFILNIFNVNIQNSAASVLNWSALVSLVLWLIWGVLFIRHRE